MTERDPCIYLKDILDCIDLIKDYMKNISASQFSKNLQVQDAVIRRLEIIGEATKNISDLFRKKYPSIPWKKMAGMRDILIHAYSGINIDRIWNVIQEDIPPLERQIRSVLQKESDA